jgi:hypothetical protein
MRHQRYWDLVLSTEQLSQVDPAETAGNSGPAFLTALVETIGEIWPIVGPSVVGVFVGMLSSLLFFLLLRRRKPRIRTSAQIAKGATSQGNMACRIKTINLAPRPALNLKAFLHLVRRSANPDDPTIRTKNIDLTRSEPAPLPGTSSWRGSWKRQDKSIPNAYTFLTYADLQQLLLEPNTSLRFRIQATDGTSGVTELFTRDYSSADIVEGKFRPGNTTEIDLSTEHPIPENSGHEGEESGVQ